MTPRFAARSESLSKMMCEIPNDPIVLVTSLHPGAIRMAKPNTFIWRAQISPRFTHVIEGLYNSTRLSESVCQATTVTQLMTQT